jgi:hypothetical protein
MAHLKRMLWKVCKNTPEFETGVDQVTPYTLQHQFIANARVAVLADRDRGPGRSQRCRDP